MEVTLLRHIREDVVQDNINYELAWSHMKDHVCHYLNYYLDKMAEYRHHTKHELMMHGIYKNLKIKMDEIEKGAASNSPL